MRKLRSDSILDSMPPHQRLELERWLLEENISLAGARQRLREHFGVIISLSPISTFARRARCRRRLELLQNELEAFETSPDLTPEAADQFLKKVIQYRALDLAGQDFTSLDDLSPLMLYAVRSRNATLREQAMELTRLRLAFPAK